MTTFLVAYDLRKPNYTEEDYEDLYNELDFLDAKRIQDSVWALKSDSTASTLYDQLRPHMHEHDRLLVFRDSKDFKSINGLNKIKDL